VLGSDAAGVRSRIDTAFARSSPVRIAIGLENATNDAITVTYALDGAFGDAVVNVAVVERDLVDTPTAGENEGTTIHHDDVVRAFETVRAQSKGTVALSVPTSVHRDHASVVVYAQRTGDLAVIGAATHDL